MIEVDGSYGEGGGQLVRMAGGLAAITGQAMRISNVRARRNPPGLAPQHLAAVRAVAGLCAAKTEGLELRTKGFTLVPQKRPAGGEVRVDVGTAGGITLVLQALVPVLLAASGPSRATLIGGTDVWHSPSWDYFSEVLLRHLSRMGLRVRARIVRHGYYPRGGGEAVVEVEPGVARPFSAGDAAPGAPAIAGSVHVSNLPRAIAERMKAAAEEHLGPQPGIEIHRFGSAQAIGPGGAITLWASGQAGPLGVSRVAQRGVRAETLGHDAAAALALEMASGATLDEHAADQVLIFMAMADGPSSFTTREVSSHASTAMRLIERFLPVKFEVVPEGALWRVRTALAER